MKQIILCVCLLLGVLCSCADGVMMGEFKYQDNMEATVTEEDLNRFGLNSSVTHFKVEKATGSKMILKSDYARLTYRKF